MRVSIITGASGFIGRRLATRCQEAQCRVVGLGRTETQGPWDDFLVHDISKEALPSFGSIAGVDTVYHLASKAHALTELIGETDEYDKIIVDGTKRVVAAAEAAGVQSFVYLSSVKAMGEGAGSLTQASPIDETTTGDPSTPYGRAKLQAEDIVLKSKLPHAVVLRPVMVYGPGQKGNLDRMAEAIRRKRFPPISENGNRRSIVHVDNLISACFAVVKKSTANRKIYIVSEPETFSTRQLYDRLRKEMGLKSISWGIPNGLLSFAASGGDLLGKLSGRRMPLDSDSLSKLLGSAWYSGEKISRETGMCYKSYPLL